MLFMLGCIEWVLPLCLRLFCYLPVGQETLTVYGQSKAQLPQWFRNHDWQISNHLQSRWYDESPQRGLQTADKPHHLVVFQTG